MGGQVTPASAWMQLRIATALLPATRWERSSKVCKGKGDKTYTTEQWVTVTIAVRGIRKAFETWVSTSTAFLQMQKPRQKEKGEMTKLTWEFSLAWNQAPKLPWNGQLSYCRRHRSRCFFPPKLLKKCENYTDNLWVKLSAICHGLCIWHLARCTINHRALYKDAGDSLENGCLPPLAFVSFL